MVILKEIKDNKKEEKEDSSIFSKTL